MRTIIGLFCVWMIFFPAAHAFAAAPSEKEFDAKPAEAEWMIVANEKKDAGQFSAKVTVRRLKRHETWVPVCSLRLDASGNPNDNDSLFLSFSAYAELGESNLKAKVKTNKNNYPLPYAIEIGKPFEVQISWRRREYTVTFAGSSVKHTGALNFTPRLAIVSCSTASGKFENIEYR